MSLVKGLAEIMANFDFTDSIVTGLEWDLFNLNLKVDYYWDLQEGRSDTRVLTLHFERCQSIEIRQRADFLSFQPEEIHSDSWFTIVRTEGNSLSDTGNGLEFRVFTNDSSHPWLKVVCSDVSLMDGTITD